MTPDHSPGVSQNIASKPEFEGDTDAFLEALSRMQRIIDEETAALNANNLSDLQELGLRKDRCLLDLSRRSRNAPGGEGMRVALESLKRSVQENQRALKHHLDAARTITAILLQAVADEDSDRTYSHTRKFKGARA